MLHVKEVEKPVPKANEVLVRVHATTVAAGDWRMRRPSPVAARLYNGLLRPKKVTTLGFELAGQVEAIGNEVKRFKVGDDVFAFTGFGFGAYAEVQVYSREGASREGRRHRAKAGQHDIRRLLRFQSTACQRSVQRRVSSKDKRCSSMELLEAWAPTQYNSANTWAPRSQVYARPNLELVKSLGADEVIDYTTEDFTKLGRGYDVVFDAVGKLSSTHGKRALKKGGVFISVSSSAKLKPDDLNRLRAIIEAGKLRAVIDRRYVLEDIAVAHEYVENGHKKGNVVITVMDKASERSGT